MGLVIQKSSKQDAKKKSQRRPNELKTKVWEKLPEMMFGYTIYYVSAT